MKLADLSFKREGDTVPEEFRWKRIAKLYWEPASIRATVLMQGFRQCLCCGRAYSNVVTPYLAGDLVVTTGSFEDSEGTAKKERLWVGRIATKQKPDGKTVYYVSFVVDPTPCLLHRQMQRLIDGKPVPNNKGLYIDVFLDDNVREKHEQQEAPAEEDFSQDPADYGNQTEGETSDFDDATGRVADEDNLPF